MKELEDNICIIIISRQIIEILQTSQACEITSDIMQSVQTERKNLEKLKVYFNIIYVDWVTNFIIKWETDGFGYLEFYLRFNHNCKQFV